MMNDNLDSRKSYKEKREYYSSKFEEFKIELKKL